MEFDLSNINLSEPVAELIGAIIGDGCIRYKPKLNQYYLEIVGNKNEEKDYFSYLQKILKEELKLKSYLKEIERGLRLKVYSKKFIEFLIYDLGLSYNKGKGETVKIPDKIIDNPYLINHCIRGICDTDGSLFLTKKSHRLDYPVIEISTTSIKLAKQLNKELSKILRISFRSYKPKNFLRIYRISINGNKMVNKWIKEIGFSNPINTKRYEKIKSGDAGI